MRIRWSSVKRDGVPGDGEWYLVWTKDGFWDKAAYDNGDGKWRSRDGWPVANVTHYWKVEGP